MCAAPVEAAAVGSNTKKSESTRASLTPELYPARRTANRAWTAVLAVRLRHLPVVKGFVERGVVDAVLARDLAERAARRRRLLDDLAPHVVADVRIERGHRGERQLGVALASLTVRLDAVDALLREQP